MLSEKSWQLELVVRYMMIVMLSLSFGMFMVGWLSSSAAPVAIHRDYLTILGGTLSFHGAVLLLLPGFLSRHKVDFATAFGLNLPRRGRAILLGILVGIIALPLIMSLGHVSLKALEWLNIKADQQAPVKMLQGDAPPQLRYIIFVAAVIVAPVAEEIVFRGILYPTIKQFGFRNLALWGTSILFAAVHSNLMTLLPFTVLAIMLTLLYESTDNLASPIAMHSFFNLVNFLLAPLGP